MLKYAHIVSPQFVDGAMTAKVMATVILENGLIRLEGDKAMVDRLKKGVHSLFEEKTVLPADGEAFLNALGVEFRSPRLFAADVMQGDAVEPYQVPPAQIAA